MPRRRILFIILAVALVGLIGFLVYSQLTPSTPLAKMSLNALVTKIHRGEVVELKISPGSAEIKLRNRITLAMDLGSMAAGDFLGTLRASGVTEEELDRIEKIFVSGPTDWVEKIIPFFSIIVMVLLLIWFSKRSSNLAGSPFGSGKSGGAVSKADRPRETFKDVGGCDEAIEDLKEVVEFLKTPERFTALGARVPKGVLLIGPPGCGKTLLARAVAGEADVPFFSMSGSEFVEMFVGVGASRVRDLFGKAKKNPPAIIFIDEIDGVGGTRSGIDAGGGREYQQTTNQILSEMDGFEVNANVVVLGATNRPDMLDPAFTRKGRFDRTVVVDRPDLNGRKLIFDIHLKGMTIAKGIDSLRLAKATPGFTGADIESTVNEAAILAARGNKKAIEMEDFDEGILKAIAGPERRSRKISEKEKNVIAHHEVGHALVMARLPLCETVHKVSIISRGLSLGYTIALPEEDQNLQSKEELKQKLAGLLGGRAAEEIEFGPDGITSGAANDLERATATAREMVVRFGMSELGLQSFVVTQEDYLRRGQFGEAGISPETAYLVEEEIRRFVTEAYERAKEILIKNKMLLKKIVDKLLEKETLGADEFAALVSES